MIRDIETPYFNLWDEAWIRVLDMNGRPSQMSLRDAFLKAHEVFTVTGETRIDGYSVMRLMVAILQVVYDPQNSRDLTRLMRTGQFDETLLKIFIEKYYDRFWLTHPSAPFFQAVIHQEKEEAIETRIEFKPNSKSVKSLFDPISRLDMTIPSGSASTFMTHFKRHERAHQFCPACCAQLLTTWPMWAGMGGFGLAQGINGANALYVIPVGNNLFETLTKQMITPAYFPRMADGIEDVPWWERETPITIFQDSARKNQTLSLDAIGYLKSLTYMPRAIRLSPGEGGTCTRCDSNSETLYHNMYFGAGEKRNSYAAGEWTDPFVGFTTSKKTKELYSIAIDPERTQMAWMTYMPLFTAGYVNTDRPAVMEQIAQAHGGVTETTLHRFNVVTFHRKQSRANVMIDDGINLPFGILADPRSGNRMANILNEIRRTEYALKKAITLKKPFGLDCYFIPENTQKACIQYFWGELKPAFDELINITPPAGVTFSDALYEAEKTWEQTVWNIAFSAFRKITRHLLEDPRNIEFIVICEQTLNSGIYSRKVKK